MGEESRKVGAIHSHRTSHRFKENTQKDEFSWGYLLCYLKIPKARLGCNVRSLADLIWFVLIRSTAIQFERVRYE